LLVVATVASYENCVKLILTNFAEITHKTPGRYVDMQYKKLNILGFLDHPTFVLTN